MSEFPEDKAPELSELPEEKAPEPKPGAQPRVWREALEWIIWLGAAVLIAMVLRVVVVEAYRIPSSSMVPTLKVNDRILVNKFIYRFRDPQRDEVVVFDPPPALESKYRLVKRIIGLPGDEVSIQDGVVYVNGKPLDEPYLCETVKQQAPGGRTVSMRRCNYPYTDFDPVRVPEGQYMVLGDNRNNSEDSRYWGFLPRKYIVGKAFLRIYPFNRLGSVR